MLVSRWNQIQGLVPGLYVSLRLSLPSRASSACRLTAIYPSLIGVELRKLAVPAKIPYHVLGYLLLNVGRTEMTSSWHVSELEDASRFACPQAAQFLGGGHARDASWGDSGKSPIRCMITGRVLFSFLGSFREEGQPPMWREPVGIGRYWYGRPARVDSEDRLCKKSSNSTGEVGGAHFSLVLGMSSKKRGQIRPFYWMGRGTWLDLVGFFWAPVPQSKGVSPLASRYSDSRVEG